MIEEGTDGLSRGMWISPSRNVFLSRDFVTAIFNPAPHTPEVLDWVKSVADISGPIKHINHMRPLHFSKLIGKTTFFTPPSHITRQFMNAFLGYWVEAPTTTSAFFLIPNVYQHDWGRVSKHALSLGTFHPRDLPFSSLLSSCLPLTLISFQKFTPRSNRLDAGSKHTHNNWHVRQADQVRGLSATNLEVDPAISVPFCL